MVLCGSAMLCVAFYCVELICFLITYVWYNSLLDPLGEKRKDGKKHIHSHFTYDSRFLKLLYYNSRERDVPQSLAHAQSGLVVSRIYLLTKLQRLIRPVAATLLKWAAHEM